MKKFAIMAALAVAALSASAVEVGVRGTHNGDNSADTVGVTVGQKFGSVGVEGGFDRSTRGTGSVNRWSVVGSYDVAKVYGLTVSPKVGVAVVDPAGKAPSGAALVAGVGFAYPLLKNVSLVGDYSYQYGQDRVRKFNGNLVSAGVKYSF